MTTMTARSCIAGLVNAAVLAAVGAALWLPAVSAAPREVGPAARQKIEAAIPAAAPAKPLKPRTLLIYDVNVGYGGHGSIPAANLAFTLMGQKTGAFETVVSREPAVFNPESLRQFDAVFLNNNVGNLFEDKELRQSLVEFVYAGGGLLGVHGTSVGFTRWPGAHEDWPEFGRMLGGRGARHLDANEKVVVKLDDRTHPINSVFGGKDFEYADEFFRFSDPYSRNRVRVLLSLDNERTAQLQGKDAVHPFRKDNDYALAWVRHYGRGRVFYSTIAHNPRVFWDATMLRFYLAAVQFALGDLPAPAIPSAKLTPALRAEEKLGWRLGVEAYTFHKYTFFEAIEKTAQLGLAYMGGLSFQKVSEQIPKNFAPGLTDGELEQIRLKLDDAGLCLLTYYIGRIPGDEAGCRKVFEFGRKLGIETFMSEPLPEALDTIEKFCDEYDIKVAIHNHGPKGSPKYWRPEGVLEVCQGRTKRIGACADMGYWMRAGIDPIAAINTLKDRLLTIQMHDLDELTAEGHDVPWGTGVGQTERFLKEIHRLGIRPVMFGLEYSYDWLDSVPEITESAAFFDKVSLELVEQGTP